MSLNSVREGSTNFLTRTEPHGSLSFKYFNNSVQLGELIKQALVVFLSGFQLRFFADSSAFQTYSVFVTAILLNIVDVQAPIISLMSMDSCSQYSVVFKQLLVDLICKLIGGQSAI